MAASAATAALLELRQQQWRPASAAVRVSAACPLLNNTVCAADGDPVTPADQRRRDIIDARGRCTVRLMQPAGSVRSGGGAARRPGRPRWGSLRGWWVRGPGRDPGGPGGPVVSVLCCRLISCSVDRRCQLCVNAPRTALRWPTQRTPLSARRRADAHAQRQVRHTWPFRSERRTVWVAPGPHRTRQR